MRVLLMITLVACSMLCSAFTPGKQLLFDENNNLFEETQCIGGGIIVIIPFEGGITIDLFPVTPATGEITVYDKKGVVLLRKKLNAPATYQLFYADFNCKAKYLKVELEDEIVKMPLGCG